MSAGALLCGGGAEVPQPDSGFESRWQCGRAAYPVCAWELDVHTSPLTSREPRFGASGFISSGLWEWEEGALESDPLFPVNPGIVRESSL